MKVLALLVAATLPAAAPLARASSPVELPPYVPAYEPRGADERGLWMEADEDERVLRDSPLLLRDESLTRYVKGVLCREVGEGRCSGVRVYLVEVPQFNASMAPNGTMRVWTGLLLRVQNEAELAAVLGHEFAHFELRHGVAGAKRLRNAAGLSAWLSVIGFAASVNTGVLQASVIGSYYRFNREQEAAADLLSLEYTRNSPYPAVAASNIWTYMMAESDARAVSRGQKPGKAYAAGFFDTHPAMPERAAYLKVQAEKIGPGGDFRAREYREAIRPFLPRLLAAQVKSNDFGGSEYLLETMSHVEGWTGELLFARGELYRQRANPRDLTTAADLFRQAIAGGYADPVVHRELGLSLLRNGEQIEGKAALQQYLTLKPDAADKGVIRMLVAN